MSLQEKLRESVGFIENSPPLPECINGGNIRVTLRMKYLATYGETLCIAGNINALGSWNINNAFALNYIGDSVRVSLIIFFLDVGR